MELAECDWICEVARARDHWFSPPPPSRSLHPSFPSTSVWKLITPTDIVRFEFSYSSTMCPFLHCFIVCLHLQHFTAKKRRRPFGSCLWQDCNRPVYLPISFSFKFILLDYHGVIFWEFSTSLNSYRISILQKTA